MLKGGVLLMRQAESLLEEHQLLVFGFQLIA